MFRTVISNAYRLPSLATTVKSSNRSMARRFYADKADEDAAAGAAGKTEEKKEPTDSDNKVAELQKSVEEKEAKIKELKNAYLRALADTENVRTRSTTEIENTKVFAIQKFAKDLLDTVDILELALKHVPKEHLADKVTNKSLVDLFEGVDMTRGNLLRTLERHGVESFDPIDKPYDPNTSHALYQTPVPGKTPGSVFSVEKRGFTIKGRVLRPAQVGVVLDPNGN